MNTDESDERYTARIAELKNAHSDANRENAELKRQLAQATAELAHARTHEPACADCSTSEFENISQPIVKADAFKWAFLATCTDPTIQELRRVAKSANRLESVLDAAKLGIWDWRPSSRQVTGDRQWHEMLGYPMQELGSGEMTWGPLMHPDEAEDVVGKMAEHIAGTTPAFNAVHRMLHKSGHWVWLLNSGQVMERDEEGKPLHATGIHQDISLCKQLEEELTKALDGAQSAARAKGAFLANMSHEIRTPMAGILGAGTLLRETTLMPEQDELARIMVESTKLLLSIVNDILDLSKVEEGFLQVEKVAMDLDDVLASVSTTFGVKAAQKGVGLEVKKHDHPHRWIVCDPTRLRQVIFNLVSNAVKFTNKGKVMVAADLQPIVEEERKLSDAPDSTMAAPAAVEDRHLIGGASASTTSTAGIDDRLTSDGETACGRDSPSAGGPSYSSAAAPNAGLPWQLCVTVEDTGIGMSRDMIAHVFDRFQQGDESITRLFGGSGLGTTISKKLAGLMGGDVLVASEEGKGSTFTVVLPVHVVPPPAESERGDDEHELSRNYGLTAILAEDNLINRRILEKTFSSLGVKTIPACNGQVVLDRVADTPHHDIIFMDIQMPVCDGITAAKRLRSNGYRRPIVALTANVMESDRQTYIDAGMDGVLPKPFTKQLICTEIDRLIKNGMLKADHQGNGSGVVPPARLPPEPPRFPMDYPTVPTMRLTSSAPPTGRINPAFPTAFPACEETRALSICSPANKRPRLDDG